MPIIHRVYPKILHKHCFLLILGITVVSEELENNAYAKMPGGGDSTWGVCENVKMCKVKMINSDPFLAFPSRSYFYGGERRRKKTRLSIFLVHLTV